MNIQCPRIRSNIFVAFLHKISFGYSLAKNLASYVSIVFLLPLFLCSCSTTHPNISENPEVNAMLGREYSSYSKTSARSGGSSIEIKNIVSDVFLYIPNRLADALDVVKCDVGLGPSFGYVVRVSKYGQIGYRSFSPISLRLGLRGRKLPLFIERSSEFGVGSTFLSSHDREISVAEVGAGLDVLLGGAYLAVSLDECMDFILGFLTIDYKNDDWHF